jgi:hypothetical protein
MRSDGMSLRRKLCRHKSRCMPYTNGCIVYIFASLLLLFCLFCLLLFVLTVPSHSLMLCAAAVLSLL